MKCSVSHGPARNRASLSARLHVLAAIAGLSLPLLAGCPGALEGNWPPAGGGAGTGGMSGTGGSGAGTGGAGTGACDAPTKWLLATTPALVGCAGAGCHSPGGSNPDFTTGDPWTTLQGNAKLGSCMGQPFVNASKPADGVLFKRLKGSECGALMPFTAAAPNQDALTCITDWVNSKLP